MVWSAVMLSPAGTHPEQSLSLFRGAPPARRRNTGPGCRHNASGTKPARETVRARADTVPTDPSTTTPAAGFRHEANPAPLAASSV
jgi:hypothetical protein